MLYNNVTEKVIILNLKEINNKIIKFVEEREWDQFHNPKDLAISLSIESNELLELFQWKSEHDITELLNTEFKRKVQEEIADIAIYLILISNKIGVNLEEAVLDKLVLNDKKYPVLKSKGNATKCTDF